VPVLTVPNVYNITDAQATFTTTTTLVTGAIHYIVDGFDQPPTPTQIVAGLNGRGNAAFKAGSWAPSSTGVQPPQTVVGLLQGNTMWVWVAQTITGSSLLSVGYGSYFTTQGVLPPEPGEERETVVSFYRRPEGANARFGG
jgi:hypothetical protein